MPVGQDDNNNIQIQFKQFGVSLAFTPTVLSAGRISMRVRPEVSDLSDKGAIKLNDLVIPALSTRRAETTVELGSGQSFAIGGLISNSTRNNLDKVPGPRRPAGARPLFRSTQFPAQRVRAGDHRHTISRRAGGRRSARRRRATASRIRAICSA